MVNSGDAQIAFVDTPGFHRPKNELGRRMNHEAQETLRGADAALFMTDIYQIDAFEKAQRGLPPAGKNRDDRSDAELIALIPKELPTLLVVNKIDRLKEKGRLLPYLGHMNELRAFAATIPISALSGDGTQRVLAEAVELLPEADRSFPEDEVTDRPVSFFAREYIREQVLMSFEKEVPHAVAVTRVVGVLQRDLARHHPGGDHRGLEARALLVGEHDHPHRVPGRYAVVVQRAQGLERAQHAELAVVAAAARHRVRVRAHEHRRAGLGAGADAEDVAHLVHRDLEPGLAHPPHQQIAAAPVVVGEGHPVEPAARGGPDAAERVHALGQPHAIDAQRPPVRHHIPVTFRGKPS